MKIISINTNSGFYKAKNTPISFKNNTTMETPKTTQFEKSVKPLATTPIKTGFFSNLIAAVKDFFEPNAQSTIATSTFGLFY